MTSGPRDYTPNTIKMLHALSGNQCYSPTCNNTFVAPDNKTLVSKICHIEGASEKGPRFNISMTNEQRRSFPNLILLCDTCHQMIDNVKNINEYSVETLQGWKKFHEDKYLQKAVGPTSLLGIAVNAISKIDYSSISEQESLNAFSIEEKINFNDVKRNKYLIEEYKVYYSKINSLYNELEIQGSFKKEKLLRYIKKVYLDVKGKYAENAIDVASVIKTNSDNILDDVTNTLLSTVAKSLNIAEEDAILAISIIVVDAFIRCKILEEPK